MSKQVAIHPSCLAIARERKRARLTQRELGEAIGTSQSNVAHAERGHHAPTLNTCLRYARAIGCPPSAIHPSLTSECQTQPPRIMTDYNDLPDDLEGPDFSYESPNPHPSPLVSGGSFFLNPCC
jgi:transcriptional regulator with XRE-family HTH domain